MKRIAGLLGSARPLRALLEGWLLGVLLYAGLLLLQAGPSSDLVRQGTLFLAGGAALWSALRMRPTALVFSLRPWWREAVYAVALSLAALAGWGAILLHPAWRPAAMTQSDLLVVAMLLAAGGPEFLAFRVGLAAWRSARTLSRRHLVWAITETHAQLVLVFALLGALVTTLAVYAQGYLAAGPSGSEGAVGTVVSMLLWTLLPILGVWAAATVTGLAIFLPPATLLSFRAARRITRRLHDLVDASEALRRGDYGVRTPVEGQDEVALLQQGFNTMADDLEAAHASLAAERDRVAQLLRARQELVAKVSHELRTPIATMRGYLEANLKALPDGAADALRHDLAVMEDEVLRLQRLIDDLLLVSQADAGGLALTPAPTDVGALVSRRVAALAPLAWEQGRVDVLADVPEDGLLALVDPLRTEQILGNLLRNALRHTPPGGIVVARAAEEDGRVLLEVRDTGKGIAPEDLPHVWERFYRGDGPRTPDGGAGIGLAVVRELAEAMGGSVAVSSQPGEGSAFRIWLPRCEAPPAD